MWTTNYIFLLCFVSHSSKDIFLLPFTLEFLRFLIALYSGLVSSLSSAPLNGDLTTKMLHTPWWPIGLGYFYSDINGCFWFSVFFRFKCVCVFIHMKLCMLVLVLDSLVLDGWNQTFALGTNGRRACEICCCRGEWHCFELNKKGSVEWWAIWSRVVRTYVVFLEPSKNAHSMERRRIQIRFWNFQSYGLMKSPIFERSFQSSINRLNVENDKSSILHPEELRNFGRSLGRRLWTNTSKSSWFGRPSLGIARWVSHTSRRVASANLSAFRMRDKNFASVLKNFNPSNSPVLRKTEKSWGIIKAILRKSPKVFENELTLKKQ